MQKSVYLRFRFYDPKRIKWSVTMIYRRIVFITLFLISFTAVTVDAYEGAKLKTYSRDQFQDYWYLGLSSREMGSK
jgi:hypothetical protein